ncbi:MAG: aldehyde dehydrogenase family protein, partial [Rugosibacter sp.]
MKPHYINHQWVESTASCPNINPSDISDRIDDYGWANASLVNQAVAAANHVFPAWRKVSIQTRADALDQIGSELIQ